MKPYASLCVKLGMLALACLLSAEVASANNAERKTFELRKGGSELVKTEYAFKRISVADPNIADVLVLSPKEFYVYGKQVGFTSMILWDEKQSRTLVDVLVSVDPTALKKKIHELFPKEDISVTSSETGVVLAGTVSGPEVVEQVLRLTERFLTKQAEAKKGSAGTGQSGGGITNLLKIAGPQQVLLEVKFAEVSRKSGRDLQAGFGLKGLGSDFAGNIGTKNVLQPFNHILDADKGLGGHTYVPGSNSMLTDGGVLGSVQDVGSLLLNLAGQATNVFINIDNFSLALNFLEAEDLARVLAEPRLVTQSGQEASFLAGGEYPYPIDNGTDGIEIAFKEFGVGLKFTPIVQSDGMITLRVAPSVTDITNTIETAAGFQPILSTRRMESTVQLRDGQTLALAGLLKENMNNAVEKVPLLGDLPVLGALFRSSGFREEKTDLIVAITPHLVKPVKEGEISFPGEFIRKPNRFEFYLEGKLEGRRSGDDPSQLTEHRFAAASAASGGGLEGQFGHTEAK